MAELSEETETLITILRHVRVVQEYISRFAGVLSDRALTHDLSKLDLDEFDGFVEINRIARTFPYGSQEYKDSIGRNKTVSLHWSRNSHHPEYHPNGVNDMNLFDWIEMICDWKAASVTYGQASFDDSLKIQIARFKLSPEQIYLVKLIAEIING